MAWSRGGPARTRVRGGEGAGSTSIIQSAVVAPACRRRSASTPVPIGHTRGGNGAGASYLSNKCTIVQEDNGARGARQSHTVAIHERGGRGHSSGPREYTDSRPEYGVRNWTGSARVLESQLQSALEREILLGDASKCLSDLVSQERDRRCCMQERLVSSFLRLQNFRLMSRSFAQLLKYGRARKFLEDDSPREESGGESSRSQWRNSATPLRYNHRQESAAVMKEKPERGAQLSREETDDNFWILSPELK